MDAAGKPKLSERQRRFVEEYIVDFNATQAYFIAYGRYVKNKHGQKIKRSYHGARNSASELLAKPYIQAEVHAARKALSRIARVKVARVLRELAYIAFGDPIELVDPDTNEVLKLGQMTANARRCIASLEVDRRRESGDDGSWDVEKCKVKTHDKLAALDKLMKYLGMYAENNAIEALLAELPEEIREPLLGHLARTAARAKNHEPDPEIVFDGDEQPAG